MKYIYNIYRKVADVRREKELAERRKNEPQLGSTQDHLVRKIFSKFRRAQQTTLPKEGSQQSDIEKGDSETNERTKVCYSSIPMLKIKNSIQHFFQIFSYRQNLH